MITEHFINRMLPAPAAMPALDAALKAAVGASYVGASSGPFGIKVMLKDGQGAAAAETVVLAHDFATRTPDQIAEASQQVDWDALKAGADAALAQIATDNGVLQGTPTNAQVIQAIIRANQRQEKIIRGLLYVARRV